MMNAVRKLRFPNLSVLSRRYFANENVPTKILFENLSTKRSILRMHGNEVFDFLQGLITNDINHVKNADGTVDCAMFTMFLNKPGRVMCDAIIYKRHRDAQSCLIECDQAVADELRRHLMLYRVRKKIDIEIINNELNVWTGFTDCRTSSGDGCSQSQKPAELPKHNDVLACADPRLNQIGTRFIVPAHFQIHDFQQIFDPSATECTLSSDSEYNYTEHRYMFGVGEGSIEMQPLKMFPFEANCDYLHGISFHKGCYLGQEFTARTYHTGVIRKRLMPMVLSESINVDGSVEYDTPITNEAGQLIGKLKGIRNRHAIGSLKVDQALSAKHLLIGKHTASTKRPLWWPRIL